MNIASAVLLASFLIGAVLHSSAALAQPRACESLTGVTIAQMTIASAQTVAAGAFTPPSPPTPGPGAPISYASLPAFCRVAVTSRPSLDSDIRIEVWLPVSGWNGKLQAVGNGAFGGTISYPALRTALASNYVAVSTDTGHTGPGAAFAVGHPEKLIDFAYRAVHDMAVAAKALSTAFYGAAPKFAYWNGCSTGGRQGLTALQRFPDDFDAIVAGSPANYATRQTFGQVWMWRATHASEASFIPASKYPVIHEAVLAACDALDGAKDGVLEDPRRCAFDPKLLACTGGDDGHCLTAAQVDAVRKIYAPTPHARTQAPLFPGLERGSELGWNMSVGAQPVGYATDYFKHLVFNDPAWDATRLDFDGHVDLVAGKADVQALDATNPDISRFLERGGKLLLYAGWNDPGIPPRNLVNYYTSVQARMSVAAVRDSVRLFMVPGMAHCGGGEGTSTFDMVRTLDAWRETGRAPDRIEASRVVNGQVERTRPLCPYPQAATYKGSGGIDDSKNFVCKLSSEERR